MKLALARQPVEGRSQRGACIVIPMKTTGNTIFIPGGTSGLGLGLALRFEAAGNTVIIAGRRTDLLDSITAEHPAIKAVVLDVSQPESIRNAFATVSSAYPETNVLINMAGIMIPEDLHDPAFLDTATQIVTTNLLGPIRLLSAFIPFLAAQKSATIINVSSGLAFVPLSITPTYSATKAAIHSFTESLRVQLADTTIEVIELAPPAVQTALMGQENSERAMPLEEFLTEVMSILIDQPEVEQVLVERVKALRFAEANGNYPEMLKMLSGR
jgi:uncharacterized oxidoreductase